MTDPIVASETGIPEMSQELVKPPASNLSKPQESFITDKPDDSQVEIEPEHQSGSNSESESEGLRKRTSSTVKSKLYSVADVESGNI